MILGNSSGGVSNSLGSNNSAIRQVLFHAAPNLPTATRTVLDHHLLPQIPRTQVDSTCLGASETAEAGVVDGDTNKVAVPAGVPTCCMASGLHT